MKLAEKIDRSSDLTLQEQVVFLIEDGIESAEFGVDEMLPSERKLCKLYGVSMMTVRRALAVLEEKGVIRKRQGIGNFVCGPQPPPAKRTKTIALGSFISETPFTQCMLSGVSDYLAGTDYDLLFFDTRAESQRERSFLTDAAEQSDGLLVLPCVGRYNLDVYTDLITRRYPVVFIDRYLRQLRISNVSTDNEHGGYLAAEHLLSVGRRHVAFVGSNPNTAVDDRVKGLKRALRERDLALDEALIRFSGPVPDPGGQAVRKLHDEGLLGGVDAIFAANDGNAMEALAAVKALGLRVPDDISLCGFDDLVFSAHLDPPLTTVRQPLEAIGREAAALLHRIIQGTAQDYEEIRLPPELIVRGSTGGVS